METITITQVKKLIESHYPHIHIQQITNIQDDPIKKIWKLHSDHGSFCLKRIKKTIPVIHYTTSAQHYLYENGVLVAEIIPTIDGRLYFEHNGYGFALYEWIEGSDLYMDTNHKHACIGMQGLAQFHKGSLGFIPPSDSRIYDRMGVWPEHYAKMADHLKRWKKTASTTKTDFDKVYLKYAYDMILMDDQTCQLIEKSCYRDWVKDIGEFGYLCHQDYGRGNALNTKNGVYILDLDNLAYDLPIRDVRKMLTERMKTNKTWNWKQFDQLISAYTSILPLTEEQIHLLYIDLLYPHFYYSVAKYRFKKGTAGSVKKLARAYRFEKEKLAGLQKLLT